jgi:AraC-like DNA-binding protein
VFEERHEGVAIALVVAGTFHYRSAIGHELLTPGSLMLGNQGQCFECGHEHGSGDRCVSFHFTPEYFDRLASEVGVRSAFPVARLPSARELARSSADAAGGLHCPADTPWDELALELAVRALQLANGRTASRPTASSGAVARVSDSVRAIEREPSARLRLHDLAAAVGLSPFHYLRTFQQVTGVTPHQFVVRTRLREAAIRVRTESTPIVEIAFGAGFGDLSNFNRAFRTEFGTHPSSFRSSRRGRRRLRR